ncbi:MULTISPECIES: phosphoadenylyl-sulfate reductase [unclassified Rathayibacter]|uniref:phosphoadenylyl-sulfate reductase n=1 Tax=unclassified Rathayibacter TaxID=2609250 RepID=UPI001889FB8C|nr:MULTISPECIES: phosphoadenylyl-sulfate reductase [unclassified Rathayibacter]MBF4461214.1 phosphoadenylyl-sulfate reductase [Rathayibacter sp. VKM Ac-2879]MBF4502625.1 phosphoadenylyl-sulfate reductase [Rathayibacter sp. VKM Ac-2878]
MSVTPAPRPAVRRSREELRALAARGAAELRSGTDEEATPAEVVAWVAENVAVGSVAVACSMADAALPHLIAERLPGVDVLFLDTGYHFVETRATRDEVERTLAVRVIDVLPEQTVAEQDAEFGAALHARDAALCCARRKVGPLRDALSGYELWATGVRREEAPTRAATPLVQWDERNGLVKVNPVAAWSFDDLLDYAGTHRVPVNLLVSNGYPSIGCAPCTQPVAPGEDPRAGRWAGLAKTECGLHL